MKRFILLILIAASAAVVRSQEIPYTSGEIGWDPDSLGNHRAVVKFSGKGRVARVVIPWRRRDRNAGERAIVVVDSTGREPVRNLHRLSIDREKGDIAFEPVSGKGVYYVYYMPFRNEGSRNYPRSRYLEWKESASPDWKESLLRNLPEPNAEVTGFQSIDALNSFYPMEIIATAGETEALVRANRSASFLVFPEDRLHPVRMARDLPLRWIEKGPRNRFSGEACRGEYYTFQLGVYALEDLGGLTVRFTDLVSGGGETIPAGRITCLNTGGIGYDGKPFVKRVDAGRGRVQSLWCGVNVPGDIEPGKYDGEAAISAEGIGETRVKIALMVKAESLPDGGIQEPRNHTRLKWLNSRLAQENRVIAPYIPLRVEGRTVRLLGRSLTLGADGLPERIQSDFSKSMTGYSEKSKPILAAPFRFVIEKAGGPSAWNTESFQFTRKEEGTVAWEAVGISPDFRMEIDGSIEFDGFLSYTVKLTALGDADLRDICMEIPLHRSAAVYMMGLGLKGGFRPAEFEWKWDVATRNQDGAWIGDVNAGLQFSLRAENYTRPLNTNFYLQKPLNLPPSWGNGGKGGISISESGDRVRVRCYGGSRSMEKGDVLCFNFNLLITPFHTLDTEFQWSGRFYHRYSPVDTAKAAGASIINIHHANAINPYINYPFIAHREMKAYIDEAHARGMKVKIYNTIRELSNRAYELFALRSLGHEIFTPGAGGGFAWLQEHLGDDYIAAWFVPRLKDAAVVNSGMSRWHNYYVEGMNWLVRHVGIDGIYIDDVAFDRVTMKRIKRVLTQQGRPGIIDLHSANQYNRRDGYINSALLYMEHFPYLNRLWFGEYFDYENNSPEFFLTEVSGIPFGLMGEMLEKGGNPWRGMVYGMTNRLPWSRQSDPRPVWKVWDEFGMAGSEMTGYWVDDCPVKTGREDVPATVYRKEKSALVALASWAKGDVHVRLRINWKRLGIDPARAVIEAPDVENFQTGRRFSPDDSIPVPPGKGWMLILKEKPPAE
jgi:hypothetical protein